MRVTSARYHAAVRVASRKTRTYDADERHLRHQVTAMALTKRLRLAIQRCGLTVRPRLWQDLGASRETDLTDRDPGQVAAKWIGNSQAVATKHCLSVTDVHFDAVTKESKVVRNAQRSDGAGKSAEYAEPIPVRTEPHRDTVGTCQMTGVGLEPTTSGLKGPIGTHANRCQI